MRPVPLWRFAPFRAPAAIDVNLCTDSVLPRSVAPGLGYAALGFCGHFSPAFPGDFNPWSAEWGRSLPKRCAILNPDRPDNLARRLCPHIEGFISCMRREFPRRKPRRSPPKTHSLHLVPVDFTGFLQKFFCSASLAFVQGLIRTQRIATVVPEPPRAFHVILIHKPAHTNIHHNAQCQERKQDGRSSVAH